VTTRLGKPSDLIEQLERSLQSIPYHYTPNERVQVATAMARGVVAALRWAYLEHAMTDLEVAHLSTAVLGWVDGKRRATLEGKLIGIEAGVPQ
jgi:hypothetical protein